MATLSEIRQHYRDKSVDEIIDFLRSELTNPSKDLAFRELWRDTLTEISVCNFRPRIDLDSNAAINQPEAFTKWLLFIVRVIAPFWFSDGGTITRKSAYTNLANSAWLISVLLFGDDEKLKIGLKNSATAFTNNKKIHLSLDDKQAAFSENLRISFNNFSDNYVKRAEEYFLEAMLSALKAQLEMLESDYVAEQMATVKNTLAGDMTRQQQLIKFIQTLLVALIATKLWDEMLATFRWIGLIVLFFNFMGIFEKLGILDAVFGRNVEFFGSKMVPSAILGFVIACLMYILLKIANWLDDFKAEADFLNAGLSLASEDSHPTND